VTPYDSDDACQIFLGDCRELLPGLRADVIVTDPPYGLEFMGKEWDRFKGANDWGKKGDSKPWTARPTRHGGGTDPFDRDRPRFHAGQPYQAWCEQWATEALRVLRPGGWLLAFGGTRTWHRLACGLEDAGFELRDTLMWLYGSGFPKSKACLKPGWEPILLARKPGSSVLQIDASRVVGPGAEEGRTRHGGGSNGVYAQDEWTKANQATMGGPMPSGRWPPNVALVHDPGCVPVGVRKVRGQPPVERNPGPAANRVYGTFDRFRDDGSTRYADPDGTETVQAWRCVEDSCPVFLLDQQSGERNHAPHRGARQRTPDAWPYGLEAGSDYDDKGGASRFFATFPHDAQDSSTMGACLPPGDGSTTDASTSAGKRAASSDDSSLTDGSGSRPTALSLPGMTSTTGTTTPSTTTSPTSSVSPRLNTDATTDEPARITPSSAGSSIDGASDATPTDPSGSSTPAGPGPIRVTARTAPSTTSANGVPPTASTTTPTCGHIECALAASSRFFYTAKAGPAERITVDGEKHPTVKPLALMRWLVRLVTPPGGTVLDPFCGSGSTLVAAVMEGFHAIGIEADERWCRGSAQRVAEIPPVQEVLAL
jgi:DNA modification methylase